MLFPPIWLSVRATSFVNTRLSRSLCTAAAESPELHFARSFPPPTEEDGPPLAIPNEKNTNHLCTYSTQYSDERNWKRNNNLSTVSGGTSCLLYLLYYRPQQKLTLLSRYPGLYPLVFIESLAGEEYICAVW